MYGVINIQIAQDVLGRKWQGEDWAGDDQAAFELMISQQVPFSISGFRSKSGYVVVFDKGEATNKQLSLAICKAVIDNHRRGRG